MVTCDLYYLLSVTICDLQSLGVFIAALVIYFKPEWNIIDPVCTFVFSVLVLGTTLRILRDTVNVLMEGGWVTLCDHL